MIILQKISEKKLSEKKLLDYVIDENSFKKVCFVCNILTEKINIDLKKILEKKLFKSIYGLLSSGKINMESDKEYTKINMEVGMTKYYKMAIEEGRVSDRHNDYSDVPTIYIGKYGYRDFFIKMLEENENFLRYILYKRSDLIDVYNEKYINKILLGGII